MIFRAPASESPKILFAIAIALIARLFRWEHAHTHRTINHNIWIGTIDCFGSRAILNLDSRDVEKTRASNIYWWFVNLWQCVFSLWPVLMLSVIFDCICAVIRKHLDGLTQIESRFSTFTGHNFFLFLVWHFCCCSVVVSFRMSRFVMLLHWTHT